MNPTSVLCLLLGLACGAQSALAMPKAAENEAAQVSQGADVARPKTTAVKPGKAPASKGKQAGAAKPPSPAKAPSAAKAQHGSAPSAAATPC